MTSLNFCRNLINKNDFDFCIQFCIKAQFDQIMLDKRDLGLFIKLKMESHVGCIALWGRVFHTVCWCILKCTGISNKERCIHLILYTL